MLHLVLLEVSYGEFVLYFFALKMETVENNQLGSVILTVYPSVHKQQWFYTLP